MEELDEAVLLRRGQQQHEGEEQKIHQVDDEQGKECASVGQVGLTLADHRDGEGGMERPGSADHQVEDVTVGRDIVKQRQSGVDADDDDTVDRDEIGREGDPSVDLVGDDVAAIPPDVELRDLPAGEIDGQRVGEFVAEDVDEKRVRQEKIEREPEPGAAGEPEKLGRTVELVDRGVGQRAEKSRGENVAGRQKKKAEDKLDPAHRNTRRVRRGKGRVETVTPLLAATGTFGHRGRQGVRRAPYKRRCACRSSQSRPL